MKANCLYIIVLAVAVLAAGCGGADYDADAVSPALTAILAGKGGDAKWAASLDSAYDGGCTPLRSRRLTTSIGRAFNDSNAVHLAAARRIGILPVLDEATAWTNARGIEEVRSDSLLFIDELTHSYPYLVPEASELLHDIARSFADSLAARGGGRYRLKVTSMLRTGNTVRRLRRVNRNATSESAHLYGTTFDISYSKFICDDATATRRTFADLKNLLVEIVDDLHRQGRCKVKHERRQACLHITATGTTKPDNEQ